MTEAGDEDELPTNRVFLEKFCMKCGGCFHALSGQEQDNLLGVLSLLKNLVRLHRGARGTENPMYLLILAKRLEVCLPPASEVPNVLAYFVTHVSLNPLDLCLWFCTVSSLGSAEMCKHVACPKAFTATLDYIVNQDHTSDRSQMSPNIRSMHQMAYEFRANGFSRFAVRVTNQYEVIALNAIRVNDADKAFDDFDPLGDRGGDRKSVV